MTATVIGGFRLGVLGGPSDEFTVKIAKIEARAMVASVPDTDDEVTADLIAELLREQHPDLADLPVAFAARGWDNQLWRLGDDLAVRRQPIAR